MVGLIWGSHTTTTEAACMLSPIPAAWICASSTAGPDTAVNASTSACLRAGGTAPVSGPNTGPYGRGSAPSGAPRASSTTRRTSRKFEKTTTFSPFSPASRTISRSRPSLADFSGRAYAALRIAMKLPSRTASR